MLPLRQALQARGTTTFVDERDIRRGQPSEQRMRAACQGATVAIVVLTRDFLRSAYCMEEVRWVLEERERSSTGPSKKALPELLVVLYPNIALPAWLGYSQPDMGKRQGTIDKMTAPIKVDDLSPLSPELTELLSCHQQQQQQPQALRQPQYQMQIAAITVATAAATAAAVALIAPAAPQAGITAVAVVAAAAAATVASAAATAALVTELHLLRPVQPVAGAASQKNTADHDRLQQCRDDLAALAKICLIRDNQFGRCRFPIPA